MIAFVTRPLNRSSYALIGFTLMILKYICEAALIRSSGGGFYSPIAFLLPLISTKSAALQGASNEVGTFLVIWSIPFVFIALVFSVRRCVDAGTNPWVGFWVLCPLINLSVMLILCLLPSRPLPPVVEDRPPGSRRSPMYDSMGAVVSALMLGAAMLVLAVYILHDYSAALFFVTPILMGAVSSYRLASLQPVTLATAVGISLFCITLALAMMLLFALEGAVCLAMAAPLVYPAGAIGGVLGYAIALSSNVHKQNWSAAVLLLPAMSLLEFFASVPQLKEVTTVVEIDAPCDQVWNEVVAFSPITAPPTGWFYWGIAYPVKARIEGEGVGAIRYCEFSTGAFVEPITVWDAPHQLAFNVTKHPSPLTELSPYKHVHAPHLDGFLSSRRGEFRLIALPGNRTRLEGHTWYMVDMYPQLYWQIWSDAIIHSIHMRVLDHIREQVEQGIPK